MVEVSKIWKAAQELDLFSWGAYGTGSKTRPRSPPRQHIAPDAMSMTQNSNRRTQTKDTGIDN